MSKWGELSWRTKKVCEARGQDHLGTYVTIMFGPDGISVHTPFGSTRPYDTEDQALVAFERLVGSEEDIKRLAEDIVQRS